MAGKTEGKLYLGTSGLLLPFKNKSFYPPEYQDKSRLSFYGSLFNSIEINSSFYKLPQPETVRKWADQVPQDFRFTFKLWQEVTHGKARDIDENKVKSFMETISEVGYKKGCLLVQLPPSLQFSNYMWIRRLINSIKRTNHKEWRIALEFRHSSWYRDETYQLLNDTGTTLVYHDKKGSQAPLEEMDADFIYVRLHGPGGDYRGSYEDALLSEYAGYIKDWQAVGKDVYGYFNNTIGDAIGNLKRLSGYIVCH
jgi:uncharacterized protein YecE (DUF72 family)